MLDEIFGTGTYEVRTNCTNCKTKQATKIKKGNIATEVIGNGKCQKCGCQNLELLGN